MDYKKAAWQILRDYHACDDNSLYDSLYNSAKA